MMRKLAQSLIIGFEGTEPDACLEELITRHGLGGVILFARNIASPKQVWQLNDELQRMAKKAKKAPLFIMVDQEGGSVARLSAPFTHGPDLAALGAEPPEKLFAHGKQMGRELVAAGFNWNLAPVVDVHALSNGIMARRSLGSQAQQVATLAVAYSQGLASAGCLACAKHFPGLGRTSLDTHKLGVMVELTKAELEAMELIPFAQAIAARIAGILVSHASFRALDPSAPASLSAPIITGLLRQHMGFQGLVLSDDLEMGAVGMEPAQAALRAYMAGTDLLLICKQNQQALVALDLLEQHRGAISATRVEQSWQRIKNAKDTLKPAPSWPELQKILNL